MSEDGGGGGPRKTNKIYQMGKQISQPQEKQQEFLGEQQEKCQNENYWVRLEGRQSRQKKSPEEKIPKKIEQIT